MAHRCLGLAGVIVLTSALVACQADSADDAGSGPAGQTASDATASPSEGPSTTAREQHCTPSSDIDVDIDVGEDATVTFGPINGVPATAADGEPLVVVGTVSSADCQPLAGATLTMYQTDGAGEYGPGHGTDEMLCCHLGGSVVTDSQGHFQVITVRPAHYRGEANPPPAHIHLEV
ncbi:MAG TPA: hypothetical protein VHI11_07160, partial [Jiangellaceae bacterium]|nr:hypothetical protein [Jiangellaceae bacterium]